MYSLNSVVYFIHGTRIIKAQVEESIRHLTQEDPIIKYILRPYGVDRVVTIDDKDVFDTLENAKKETTTRFIIGHDKKKYQQQYKDAKKRLEETYDNALKNFDQITKETIDKINNTNDEHYDDMEKSFQEEKLKIKQDEINNENQEVTN